jgi:5-dehydro-2-deoxygluconokinase
VGNGIIKNKFLILGRAGLDLYADPPGTRVEEAQKFSAALGGSAANIAAGITRLGGQASLVTAVSNDAVGRYTINELKKYGVGTEHVIAVGGEARNSLAVVETRSENCQSVIYRNGAADFQISKSGVKNIPYTDYSALIVTGTALAVEPSRSATFLAIEIARKSNLKIILDVDYRPYSWVSSEAASKICLQAARLSDIVIGNDDEFAVMGGGLDLAKSLAAEIVIYKMGEKGSITFSKGKSFETGIFKVAALKPTGAGDAFMAAFVTSQAAGLDLKKSVQRGSAAAAIVVTRVGCAPAMPTESELSNFMVTHAHSAF